MPKRREQPLTQSRQLDEKYIAEVMKNGTNTPRAIFLGDQAKASLQREERKKTRWWRRK